AVYGNHYFFRNRAPNPVRPYAPSYRYLLDDFSPFRVATYHYAAGRFAEQNRFREDTIGVKANLRADVRCRRSRLWLYETGLCQRYRQAAFRAVMCRLNRTLFDQLA